MLETYRQVYVSCACVAPVSLAGQHCRLRASDAAAAAAAAVQQVNLGGVGWLATGCFSTILAQHSIKHTPTLQNK
jgi:hypothetical protein